jgi:hypothetical protein
VAVSGTVSQTTFNTRKVIDHAFRRCRLPPQGIGGEMIATASEALYLILSNLANRGIQLWCIQKDILPLYEAVSEIPLPVGTVDILNANFRTLTELTGTETSSSTAVAIDFGQDIQVTNVGVLFNGASTAYTIETSPDGSTWTTVATVANPSLTSGEWNWTDLQGTLARQYCRVVASTGTLNQSDVFFGNTPTEIPMARINRDDYSNLPNKTVQGRPLQFWLNRQRDYPIMNVWQVPNGDFIFAQIVCYVKRYIMDVGTMTQEIEVPQRWYDAIVYCLAAKLAEELPSVDPQMLPILDQKMLRALKEAEDEERDNSPIYFTPNIAIYTR